MCWNCRTVGHLSRDCPTRRRSATCYGCGVVGHIRLNCPERGQSSVAVVARETRSHPYRRFGRINGQEVDVLLDTGSHYNLVKASVAISCGLSVKPTDKSLYGLGSTTIPSVRAVGMAYAEIAVDDVCPGQVSMLVVPDTVQQPDVIIGREWLDMPSVEYRKVDGQLHLYRAEPCTGQTETTVTTVGCDADFIHTVEQHVIPARLPLLEADFGYVKLDATAVEREGLIELVNEYRECFAKDLGELGCTPLMTVDINEVPGSRPVVCRPYKTTPSDREEIAKIVADWKLHGVVRDTVSPYASPVLLVKQAGGKNRLCIDFRRLNKQTVRQHYPLPDMHEQLESLAEGRMFTQLDLASGYLQIPLSTEASEKTAFITSDTTGEFTRMPFGLSGAVAEFTRLMQRVLGPLQGKTVRNYLDDMIIEGRDWTDMLRKLRLVLDRLRDAKLTLKPSKCQFGTAQVEFLGFVVEIGEIRPYREKTRAIVEYPVPSDVHSVRRFLGLTGFFRRFVLGYAVIAEPLTALLRKGVKFQWADGQKQAFRKLQDALVGDTVQCMFRRDAEVTELHTDASADGLGAVLLQSMEKGEGLRLVYCASRKTSDAESRYHSSKLELLCLVWAVNKLRQFLLGIKFVILTDCQALVYLNNFKNLNAQVARWHDSLQEYEYEVKYRAGHQMTHVDALSRAPVSEEPPLDDVLAERIDVVGVLLSEEERVAMCQSSDVDIARVKLNMSTTGDTCGEFVLKGGLLYRRHRDNLLFVMPKSMRKSLVVTAHDLSGHPAVDITVANILQDFWFSGMRRYVRLHINVCFECLLAKDPRGKRPGYLHPIPIGKRPFDTVHIDHVGPFVTTPDEFKYVLTIVDNFTKFISLYAVKATSADQLIERVQLFVDTYGLPRRFVTDRGSCYTSGAFELFCLQRGIVLIWNSSRHPQANGQVERSHSVVMAALRTAGVDPDGWSELLPDVQRVINNSESKTTTRTPFEMLHGYRPRFHLGALRGLSTTVDDWTPPEGLRIGAHQAMEVSKRKMKIAYDARRYDNTHYQVGEVVVMKRAPNSTGESTKLQNRYRGPLVVSEVLPGDVYRVTDLYSGRPSRFSTTAHVAQLKSWKLIDAEEEGRLAAVANVPGDAATTPEMSNQDADRSGSVVVQKECRPRREPRPPVWLKDYDTCS